MACNGQIMHSFMFLKGPILFFSAQILLDTLCSKDECIREAVAACERAANEGRFRLRDLLAVPVQRVLKYHLLLKELVTHTRKPKFIVFSSVHALLDLVQLM